MQTFLETLQIHSQDDQHCTFEVQEDWLQGRSLFGGLQAALAVKALRTVLGLTAPLRSLQTTFLAPIPADRVRIEAKLLRQGKAVTFAEARIVSVENETLGLYVATFGDSRASQIAVPYPTPDLPEKGADGLREIPFFKGIAPNFIQHFDMRWAEGGWPFSASNTWHSRIWLKGRNFVESEDTHLIEVQIIALADAIPSPTLAMMKKPAPASSVTWALDILAHPSSFKAGFWRMDAQAQHGQDGYVSQTATLFDPDNQAIALARQVVVVFA
jgi:acyl-CoA thioesterase